MDPVRPFGVNVPQPNATVDAFENRVCLVAGQTAQPAENYLLGCILVWGTDPTTGIAKGPYQPYPYNQHDDYFDLNDERLVRNGDVYSWTSTAIIPCKMTAAFKNKVSAQASWNDDLYTGQILDPTVIVPTEFYVEAQAACGGYARLSEKERLAHRARTASPVDRNPAGRRGHFLQYKGIPIADSRHPTLGSRLMSGGSALRCSAIRVSAFDVAYSYGGTNNRIEINRPSGPTLSSAPSSTHPDLPAWSVVIYQPSSLRRYVVLSDNRKRPDILHLDITKDIYVLVNIQHSLQATVKGSFGLYIDPIT
jgi:hypothetical protein